MNDGKMVTCTNCGNERPEGTRFCGNCGTPFVQADQQLSSGEPSPIASSTRKRRLVWVAVGAGVALLVAGGAVAATLSLTGDDQPSQAEVAELEKLTTPTEPDLFGDTTDTTDIFGDTTDTTGATGVIGQGVDQTCEEIVVFFALAKEVDIARGGNSVDGVEQLAAAASDLASNAPAEPEGGEPRDSFQDIAFAYGTYANLLSELDVDPGPDALLEPRIADALGGLEIAYILGVVPWIDARCSAEVKAQLEELGVNS